MTTLHETNPTSSRLVHMKLDLTCGAANTTFGRFWRRPDIGQVAPAFLVLLHQIVRASVPLLEAARDAATARAREDPLCAALAAYYGKHAVEERDHDLWTLEDLEAVGYSRDQVTAITPLPDVAALVGAQYYWLHHFHPVMLLGYIVILEGSPPSTALIDRLERETGLPPEAFRTYRFHSEIDVHHLADLDRTIDTLPLTRRDLGLIGISATHTANALAGCMDRLTPSDAPERAA